MKLSKWISVRDLYYIYLHKWKIDLWTMNIYFGMDWLNFQNNFFVTHKKGRWTYFLLIRLNFGCSIINDNKQNIDKQQINLKSTNYFCLPKFMYKNCIWHFRGTCQTWRILKGDNETGKYVWFPILTLQQFEKFNCETEFCFCSNSFSYFYLEFKT